MECPTQIYHYLYRIFCFEFRVISVEYFMDSCSLWEIDDILDNIPYLDRNLWESQRLNTYMVAQVNSTKRLQMTDICKFKWEETEKKEKVDIEISNEDIERMKQEVKKWER